jgi:hypothetical protein
MLSFNYSGVVQLVARQPLELVILVRVQAPEPFSPDFAKTSETPALKIFVFGNYAKRDADVVPEGEKISPCGERAIFRGVGRVQGRSKSSS